MWEARNIYQLKVVSSKEPVETQFAKAIKNLSLATYSESAGPSGALGRDETWFENAIRGAAFPILGNQVSRLHGVELILTNDSLEQVIPSGKCKIEQLVIYNNWETPHTGVLMNQDLIDLMDNTNQAGLLLHEALYAFLRGYGEKDSRRTRRTVGLIIGGYNVFKDFSEIATKSHIICSNKDNRSAHSSPENLFYIFEWSQQAGKLWIVPILSRGKFIMGSQPDSMTIPSDVGLNLENFLKPSAGNSDKFNQSFTEVVSVVPTRDTYTFSRVKSKGKLQFLGNGLALKCSYVKVDSPPKKN